METRATAKKRASQQQTRRKSHRTAHRQGQQHHGEQDSSKPAPPSQAAASNAAAITAAAQPGPQVKVNMRNRKRRAAVMQSPPANKKLKPIPMLSGEWGACKSALACSAHMPTSAQLAFSLSDFKSS
jgi:hypothetical protein